MIVGIDAGSISGPAGYTTGGLHRIAKNFIKELAQVRTRHDFRLYSFSKVKYGFKLPSSFKEVVLQPSSAWYAIRLPVELTFHPVDIFIGLSQAIPKGIKGRKIAFVYDVGFYEYPRMYPKAFSRLQRLTDDAVRRADHIISISQSSKKDIMCQYNIPRKKITVCYPGIERVFSFQGKKKKLSKPYFLYVGSYKIGKNIPSILRAFALFLEKTKVTCNLICISADPVPSYVAPILNRYELSKRVIFLSKIKDSLLAQYYRGAIALIQPSRIEGFCFPAVEAMACGCPVISSTISAIKEVVGKAGILVEPTSEIDIARAMQKVLKPKTRILLVQRGIQQIKRYSWRIFTRKILEQIS